MRHGQLMIVSSGAIVWKCQQRVRNAGAAVDACSRESNALRCCESDAIRSVSPMHAGAARDECGRTARP